jgi:hypothetical protein
MAHSFPDAPLQTGQGRLTIEFKQFFYLVNFERTRGASNFRGAVVLCPARDHNTLVTLTPSYPPVTKVSLRRKQVDVFVASATGTPTPLSRSGHRTVRSGREFLPTSQELFQEPMGIQSALLTDKRVPERLNARFVLADGSLHEKEADCPEAAHVNWDFHRPGKHVVSRKLTDRLDYELTLRPGQRYWLVVSNGERIDKAYPLGSGQNSLEVLNFDEPAGPFAGELRSYAALHSEVLIIRSPGAGEMKGTDPGCMERRRRGAAEPICGGEQGDPEPPEDPPDPPDPNP